MANQKIKASIKTDGTISGTSLLVNGVDITKTMQVTRVYFSAYSDSDMYISWDVLEKDDKGIEKRTTYSFNNRPTENGLVKVSNQPAFIGKDADIQFETKDDENSYKTLGSLKTLKDDDVKDLSK